MDDEATQVDLLTRALVFVFATGTESPFATSLIIVQRWAAALYALGVRHTDITVDVPVLPQWLQAAVKEQVEGRAAVGLDPAAGRVPDGFASVAKAPKRRKRAVKK